MASSASKLLRASLGSMQTAQDLPPAVMRQQWEEAVLAQSQPPAGTSIVPTDVAGISGAWIGAPDTEPTAAIFYLQGGGYNVGSYITHRELAARISYASGLRALLINYRLAPEDPFPAAIEDAVAAYEWLLSQGFDPARLIIGGDSAGGGLALATLLKLRDTGHALPAAGFLISPWVDLSLSGPTMETRAAIDPITSRQGLQRAATWYLGNTHSQDPLASPLFGKLDGLPPLLVQVGNDEILLSDSTRLAEQARAAGVDVTLEIWDEMWHVWHAWAAALPEGQQAIEQIGGWIRQQLGLTTT
jgi:epsilon-lactone hydrolase